MGKWAKKYYGEESFNSVGIALAGTSRPEFEKEVLEFFDETLSFKDRVYHPYLARKGDGKYPVVFNIYGAPAMIDCMANMHDGGCRNLLFVGYAYGFKNLEVGSVVLVTKSYHFDGIYKPIEPDRTHADPDKKLLNKVKEVLESNDISFIEGTNISVPAVTFQLPHANEAYQKINPTTVEMELASCLSRAHDVGIRAVGILVISDNKKSAIGDEQKRKLRHEVKGNVIKSIVDNLKELELEPLKIQKPFVYDEYLAKIIEYPDDVQENVYRDG